MTEYCTKEELDARVQAYKHDHDGTYYIECVEYEDGDKRVRSYYNVPARSGMWRPACAMEHHGNIRVVDEIDGSLMFVIKDAYTLPTKSENLRAGNVIVDACKQDCVNARKPARVVTFNKADFLWTLVSWSLTMLLVGAFVACILIKYLP